MKFSAPFIATIMAATANADYIYSSSSGSADVSSKSSKASGKSGKAANPTGRAYTVCAQSGVVTYNSDLGTQRIDIVPYLPRRLVIQPVKTDEGVVVATGAGLVGDLNCDAFGIQNATCVDNGYAKFGLFPFTSTAYATATGDNPLKFSAAFGVFPNEDREKIYDTADEGLITTYSLTCATPAVTNFETKEGVGPVNICSIELTFQKPELDLNFEAAVTIALYDLSDGVECSNPNPDVIFASLL